MSLHIFGQYLHEHMVFDDVMHRGKYPPAVSPACNDDTHKRRSRHVEGVSEVSTVVKELNVLDIHIGIEELNPQSTGCSSCRLGGRSAEIDTLDLQRCVAPDYLHRVRQLLPYDRGSEDVVL
jgi:hypothetical protein